ncbi:bifunctional diguanylate cyclase/phosphodiesterase [Fusibacter sp. 3D3]|uniref:putative bifunctional diguanylate cyclase/phosphodiesterase n=1 Tax=Fusibacter sp. 3D3 TaxID=1048380 RepID=UPI000853CE81|nr:bifunctional diguanylate cyclase/phosphodiesterase [Fusibacter sp. 3D3]GAU76849.1 diguanylate cyclase/phosphodiesterase [Fusibacter sp. 3D3]
MKQRWIYLNLIQLILLLGYSIVALLGEQLFSNVLSPLLLFTTVIILNGTRNKSDAKLYWQIIMYLVLSWAIVDTIWLLDAYLFNGNPEENVLYSALYLIPNLLLATACGVYFYQNFKKWHFIQIISDMILVIAVLFFTINASLLEVVSAAQLSNAEFSITMLYILTDIFIFGVMIGMAQTKKKGNFNIGILFLIGGIFLYPVSDLLYTYMIYYDFYIPNNISDVLFMISFSFLGYASTVLYNIRVRTNEKDKLFPFVAGPVRSHRIKWVILIPILFLLVGYVDIIVVLKAVLMLGLHRFVSQYFSKVREIETLLEREKQYNDYLEEHVRARTSELQKSNETLNYLANMDTLSDLPNRRSFLKQVEELVTNKAPFSLFFVDIDRFKLINDIHGHEMGDQVICALSNNLKAWKPDNLKIYRIGGDEYGIILQRADLEVDIKNIASQILSIIKTPIEIEQFIFSLEASMGISKFPEDTDNRVQLLKYVDIAMLQAKKMTSGEKIVHYKSYLSESVERANQVELLLKSANYDNEFELYFQPQLETGSERLVGAEALLRWVNPILGAVSPAEFIPIAEQSNTILAIGKWVLKKSMQQLALWNNNYDSEFKLSVNISPVQFDSIDFFAHIIMLINATSVDASNLDFEITENSAMNSNVVMEEIFTALSGLGIHISIDDFGTGYSSLSYIKRFDIDRLKIAKELVDNIATDHVDRLIIKAITMMAKGMGLITIAEGVETFEQLSYLKLIGCDEIQGYYYNKPLPKEAFEAAYFIDTKN